MKDYQFRKVKNDPKSEVTGYKFETYLVGKDAEFYCVGYVKGSLDQCNKAKEKFAQGLRLRPVEGRLGQLHRCAVYLDTGTGSREPCEVERQHLGEHVRDARCPL